MGICTTCGRREGGGTGGGTWGGGGTSGEGDTWAAGETWAEGDTSGEGDTCPPHPVIHLIAASAAPDYSAGMIERYFRPGRALLVSGLVLILWGVQATAAQHSPLPAGDGQPLVFLPAIFADPSTNIPIPFGPVHSGEGTYYYATGAGNCMFPATPNNLMVAAMNHTDYANAALCGAFIRVDGPNGSVIVRIVDRCPECAPGDVDLSVEAFGSIADIPAGRVPITWQLISYPVVGPIIYQFKDGSSQWWTAVQIRNHRNPIATVEFRNSQGVYVQVPRQPYNYFVQLSGMGPGPYTFRVTDVLGNVIVDSGIPLVANGEVPGAAQFPPP